VSKVFADISVSLDGFITGPNDSVELGLGEGGERLHEWIVGLASWRQAHGMEGGEDGQDSDVMEEAIQDMGAVVMGRRMFDHGEEPWGDEPPFRVPVFVLTHRPRDPLEKKGGTTFTFVTDGVESAVARAREAAGDRNVSVAGGAQAIQQVMEGGLLDEMQIHLVPVLLGGGVRLFENMRPRELERTRVIDSPGVTHMKFRVRG
jgi:dihydrofolate reductase